MKDPRRKSVLRIKQILTHSATIMNLTQHYKYITLGWKNNPLSLPRPDYCKVIFCV